MQIHNIKKNKANKSSVRVGRGGKRGKTSGKGTKGQKARTGNSTRPEIRDMIKKLPKLRGYRFKSIQSKLTPVNLSQINSAFDNGDKVNPKTLIEKGLVSRVSGKVPAIKILSTGSLDKKLFVAGCVFSQSTKDKVEKAGGSIK